MNDFLAYLLIGHVIGDFYLQPLSMAVKKGGSIKICAGHCAIYTAAIALFTGFNPVWLAFVFASHFIVDYFSLADEWLQIIRGRSLKVFIACGHADIPPMPSEQALNYRILRGAFAAKVYLIIDAGLHLIPMYFVWKWYFSA